MLLEKLHEECGIFGVYEHADAANLTYLGLQALQHRGQEGAGIVTIKEQKFFIHKGLGVVKDIFTDHHLQQLNGTSAIGHVRYSTTGTNALDNVQPFSVQYRGGQIAIAHNGNLVNAGQLRKKLEDQGSIFLTSSDTEVILHLLARSALDDLEAQLIDALSQVKGAYSLLFFMKNAMIAVRDPHGFRPLVLGTVNGSYVVASETCALNVINGQYIREIEPGELLFIQGTSLRSLFPFPKIQRKACIFEWIYFARPDSTIFGHSVYERRTEMGRMLAREHTVDADIVIPVPDSGNAAAIGYSEESGIPYQLGFIRSHYVGRTFIEPSQQIRDSGVRLKLAPIRSVLENKRVIVVDDSIVRGTTSKKIVRMLRENGVKEVHLRITAPPIIGSCYYGVDTPTTEELIAHRLSIPEICSRLGIDSLAFLSLDSLRILQNNNGFCEACFTKEYPIEMITS